MVIRINIHKIINDFLWSCGAQRQNFQNRWFYKSKSSVTRNGKVESELNYYRRSLDKIKLVIVSTQAKWLFQSFILFSDPVSPYNESNQI